MVYHDIPILVRRMGQQDFWDLAPYKPAEQLLAGIHGRKGAGDDRVLRPCADFADRPLAEFIAQAADPAWRELDLRAPPNPRRRRTSLASAL